MFENIFSRNHTSHVSYNTPAETYRPSPSYSVLREVNRNVLRRFALRTLARKGYLSPRLVEKSRFLAPEAPEPKKTFTVQVYGDEIGTGNRVFFANSEDLNTLMRIMEDIVGEERMGMIKKSISTNEPDDVEKVGMDCYKKWMADIDWPLAPAVQP